LGKPAPIEAVIFDLGHTIWDYAPTEAAWRYNVIRLHRRLDASHGGDVPGPQTLAKALTTAVSRWMKVWDSDVLEQPATSVLVGEALAECGLSPSESDLDELAMLVFGRELDIPVVPPDSLATLDTLQSRGIRMGCVTNTISLDVGINDALQRLGLHRYFRSVVCSSVMGFKKPHRSLFECALAELEAGPASTVFVGDRLVDDVRGAQSVGMRGVLTHQFRQEELGSVDVKPDAVVKRLAELPAVIAACDSGSSYPAPD
jgi:putative hydrolase of the HAD superfamily